jgi:flagellar export protein FliJ
MSRKRFTFQLQTVLDVHESETEKARLELLQAVKRTAHQSEKVEHIRALMNDSMNSSDATPNGSVALLRRDGTYRIQLQRELAKEERLLSALLHSEAEARRKLVGRRKKEETVRALRDTALAEHRVEHARLVNNESDELAMLTAARRRRRSA